MPDHQYPGSIVGRFELRLDISLHSRFQVYPNDMATARMTNRITQPKPRAGWKSFPEFSWPVEFIILFFGGGLKLVAPELLHPFALNILFRRYYNRAKVG